MTHWIRAVLLDSGDTLVNEATEIRQGSPLVLRADLIPGAAYMLRRLKAWHYPLALVADGLEQSFINVLGQHDLYHLFDAYAISERVQADKPDARMFRCALDALAIPPQEYGRVLMVGNHLERDIRGANALGLISVWLDWSPRRPKVPAHDLEVPAHTLKTPLDLLGLIEQLECEHGGSLE